MTKLNVMQQIMVDTGMLAIKLPVKSDTTEYEVKINADCLCDFCQEYYTEDEMRYVVDAAICEGCYVNVN